MAEPDRDLAADVDLIDGRTALDFEPSRPLTIGRAIAAWTSRQRIGALVAAVVIAVVIGVPTDVIPNPVFGRPVPVTWWSYPVLVVTAVLGGALAATYIRPTRSSSAPDPGAVAPAGADTPTDDDGLDQHGKRGSAAALLSYFAVGCPVCNKLVVLALGTVGAREWFEPLQPVLAIASIALMVVALRSRLRSADGCTVTLSRS